MKRELKRLAPRWMDIAGHMDCRAYPDEKGIETRDMGKIDGKNAVLQSLSR